VNPAAREKGNPLFYQEKTMMVFGDAKELLQKVVGQLKAA
jgi:NAD/NADP transhydrogenase beta subunit